MRRRRRVVVKIREGNIHSGNVYSGKWRVALVSLE